MTPRVLDRSAIVSVARSAALALTVVLVALGAACNASAPPKPPVKKSGGGQAIGATTAPGGTTANGTTTEAVGSGTGSEETPIAIERKDTTAALSFPDHAAMSIPFLLTGDAGKDVIVGLLETPKPDGPKLVRDGSNVTVEWAKPKVGKHNIRFILRDKAKCEAAAATNCEITEADFGVVGANDAYDVTSDRYEVEITASGTATSNPTTGAGTTGIGGTTGAGATVGGGVGGAAGGNNAIINQIMGLLGGGANGNIQGLLSSLTGGQLTQVLNLVQGGGGGNIMSIIQLVQGLGLQEGASGDGGSGSVPAGSGS